MKKLADPCLQNWEGARAFLEVARNGSFRSASQVLHLSVNTLRRHVDEFEREVGFPLFTRHVDGVRLTTEGELLVDAVKRMEAASFDILRATDVGASMHGKVRMNVADLLGVFWLSPRLVNFQRAHLGLQIDLCCAREPRDVLRNESDLSVQLLRPSAKDLRIVKLGCTHFMLHASQAYLDAYGTPKTISDLLAHRIVLHASDNLPPLKDHIQRFLSTSPVNNMSFISNTSISHLWLIACGGGIGFLPTYTQAIGDMVVPIDVEDTRFALDIWLTYHPSAAKITRFRILIDWLTENFSPKKYPWFADEFIHPRDMPTAVREFSMPLSF